MSDEEFTYRDIFRPSIDWKNLILPSLGSVLVNGALFYSLDKSICSDESVHIEHDSVVEDNCVEEILASAACTKNPDYGKITDEERAFLDILVEDLQDKHLDSMPFGEWMVTAEVYAYNSEQKCLEQKWDLNAELEWYHGFEQFVLDHIVKSTKPPFIVNDIFSFLHNRSSYSTSDAEAVAFAEEHKEFFRGILVTSSDSQARPLVAKNTGKYNCKAGTQWLTAIGSAHPAVGDNLKTMVYDQHELSVLYYSGNETFFENTDSFGSFFKPEIRGVVRDKEMHIVEYLLFRDVDKKDLPKKFQDWYKQKDVADGLIHQKTNTFGIEAKVGVRSKTIADELEEVPSRYPVYSCYSGLCAIPFDSSKYDWKKIFMESQDITLRMFFGENEDGTDYPFWRDPYYYENVQKMKFALINSQDSEWTKGAGVWDDVYQFSQSKEDRALAELYNHIMTSEKVEPVNGVNPVNLYLRYSHFNLDQLDELLNYDGPAPNHLLFVQAGSRDLLSRYEYIEEQEGGKELIAGYREKLLSYVEKYNKIDVALLAGQEVSDEDFLKVLVPYKYLSMVYIDLLQYGLHDSATMEQTFAALESSDNNLLFQVAYYLAKNLDDYASYPQAKQYLANKLESELQDDRNGDVKIGVSIEFCYRSSGWHSPVSPVYTPETIELTKDLAERFCSPITDPAAVILDYLLENK